MSPILEPRVAYAIDRAGGAELPRWTAVLAHDSRSVPTPACVERVLGPSRQASKTPTRRAQDSDPSAGRGWESRVAIDVC
jgi:hypothetical protein